jgi:hypothetical protein
MNAVIKIKPEELTDSFFRQLQAFSSSAKLIEIRITDNDLDLINNLPEHEIEERLKLFAEKKTISFTMEEFEQYVHKPAI